MSALSAASFMAPFSRAGVSTPGISVLPDNVERHTVPGGGSRALEVEAGDIVNVLDVEGLQAVELVHFTPDGKSDAAHLGTKGDGAAIGLQRTLSQGGSAGLRVKNLLEASGFSLADTDRVMLFNGESVAGECRRVTAMAGGLLCIAVPGGPMMPDEQNVATPVVVFIERVRARVQADSLQAPAPLAEPLLDENIQPGNAVAFEAKKGQYIQVLDVQGRECSDFQALSARALDKGLERDIDPTTTRSLGGALYPTPGIFSKYYSQDHEPLVEIVQDTCGRHDTFGLACTARYYEDLGYPGHRNCTDNMNRQLQHYGIRPRGGWPAINFFFNTLLDDTNAILMNDPWSRPGDYVLLRALTDLVCIATACPCDVDPANGWNPTDIQARVYGKKELFKRSIGFRKTPEADVEQTQETGFHACFAEHTRDFIEYNGYWLANTMIQHGTIAEYWACREKAAIMDLSPLRKYEVTGPDAEALMQLGVTRNMKKLSVGQVVYTAMCYKHGGMVDDGTVFRLDENNFRWIGGNDDSGLALRELAQKHDLNAWVRNSTEQLCNVAVQGPLSREILADVIWTAPTQASIDELGWFRFSVARIGDFHGAPVIVSRTGYSGELGYEVFCHPNDARVVFDALWQSGEPRGMVPLGLAALDMLRIESGLVFAGYEFSDRTDPFEAGIGFTVPLKSKEDDFVGRQTLEQRKLHPQCTLIGLELEGGVVPMSGDCVRVGRAQVGEITSAMKSPILGKTIALARIDLAHAIPGTAVEVGQLDGLQKRLAATVVSFPHFDPTKERVKGNYL